MKTMEELKELINEYTSEQEINIKELSCELKKVKRILEIEIEKERTK